MFLTNCNVEKISVYKHVIITSNNRNKQFVTSVLLCHVLCRCINICRFSVNAVYMFIRDLYIFSS